MNRFFISDQHYGHANILKFVGLDGKTRIRPEYDIGAVEYMNEDMIRRHNSVVGPRDKVYFLGDVAFNAKVFHDIMPRLNGTKSLILGNHDKLRPDDYLKYFKNIYSARFIGEVEPKIMLCHYPLHQDVNKPNYPICVHGHIHEKEVMREVERPAIEETYMATEVDPRYFNVSVERINYTPIELEDMLSRIRKRMDELW